MLRKLFSWLFGLKIGEVRYYRDSPYMIGKPDHFLPVNLWGRKEWESVRFRMIKCTWNGFSWDKESVTCKTTGPYKDDKPTKMEETNKPV